MSVSKQVMVRDKKESGGRQLPCNVSVLVKMAERGVSTHVSVLLGECKTFLDTSVCLHHGLFVQPRKNRERKGERALFRESGEENIARNTFIFFLKYNNRENMG